MRFSFSAFVFHVFVLETTAINDTFGSTSNRKMTKNHPPATAPPTPTPPIRYLVAQPAQECSVRMVPHERTTEAAAVAYQQVGQAFIAIEEEEPPRSYTLSATVSAATIAFAERPTRTALSVLTQDFVEEFAVLFETSNPNGALTFFSEDAASSSSAAAASSLDGPLIAVLSEPKIVGTNVDSTLDVEYTITQSDSQRAVGSIETFMDNTFRSCSIFIDGLTRGKYFVIR